jgi:hypothetical protein
MKNQCDALAKAQAAVFRHLSLIPIDGSLRRHVRGGFMMFDGSARSARPRLKHSVFAAVVFGSSSILPLAATPAQATDYEDTFDVAIDSLRCGFFVSTQLCAAYVPFEGGDRSAQIGDTFKAYINLDGPLTVPGSTGGSITQALLVDATAYPGGLASGSNQALATLTLNGYSGSPLTVSGPQIFSFNFAYAAFAGLCCGEPTEPYTFTGAQADFQILSDAVRPLAGLVFGFSNVREATPQTLSDFQGGNPDAPVILPAGLVGEITGQIGGAYPPASYYGFDWGGGLFQTQATIFGAEPPMSFNFKLFDSFDGLVDSITLDQASNNFDALMTIGSLNPGKYKIGLQTSDIPDPSFRIQFLTPVGLAGAVPEPSTWAMLLLGFGLVGASMRAAKRRPKGAVSYS